MELQPSEEFRARGRGTAGARRSAATAGLRLAFGCASILLMGAATACGGSAPAPPQPGAWGAATHLDHSRGGEDTTSVSCPSASFCVAGDSIGNAFVRG